MVRDVPGSGSESLAFTLIVTGVLVSVMAVSGAARGTRFTAVLTPALLLPGVGSGLRPLIVAVFLEGSAAAAEGVAVTVMVTDDPTGSAPGQQVTLCPVSALPDVAHMP